MSKNFAQKYMAPSELFSKRLPFTLLKTRQSFLLWNCLKRDNSFWTPGNFGYKSNHSKKNSKVCGRLAPSLLRGVSAIRKIITSAGA